MTDKPHLTHIDDQGNARMVNVGQKQATARRAIAMGKIWVKPATMAVIKQGGVKKGDVLAVAQLAAIQGAKRTSDLIPLCHPLGLDGVKVDIELNEAENTICVTAECSLTARTGVEMEALTAVSVGCLTLYDMLKAIDKDMVIGEIRLLRKEGGKSGLYSYDQR